MRLWIISKRCKCKSLYKAHLIFYNILLWFGDFYFVFWIVSLFKDIPLCFRVSGWSVGLCHNVWDLFPRFLKCKIPESSVGVSDSCHVARSLSAELYALDHMCEWCYFIFCCDCTCVMGNFRYFFVNLFFYHWGHFFFSVVQKVYNCRCKTYSS